MSEMQNVFNKVEGGEEFTAGDAVLVLLAVGQKYDMMALLLKEAATAIIDELDPSDLVTGPVRDMVRSVAVKDRETASLSRKVDTDLGITI